MLGKSSWAVLGLTLHIELFTLVHYKQSIESDAQLDELWKDVFLFHWKEESQHAVMDELEWVREDKKISVEERDQAVTELIELVGAVDGILQAQAEHDAGYFMAQLEREVSAEETRAIRALVLKAYRWQYIVSGVQLPRFGEVLTSMITPEQGARIQAALAPLMPAA